MTITLPVERHVKNYLTRNTDILKKAMLTDADPEAAYLIALMDRRIYPRHRYNELVKYEMLELRISSLYINMSLRKKGLSLQSIIRFNLWIKNLIKKEFIRYVENALIHNPSYEVAHLIRLFELKYELHDSCLNFENLKKTWYRYKKKFNVNLSLTA